MTVIGRYYDNKSPPLRVSFFKIEAVQTGMSMTPSWRWQHIGVFLVLLLIFFSATLGMLDLAGALGEEIGWRGFLVPAVFQLTHRNFTATVLINAAIWACWHAPIIFFSSYNNPGVPRWYSFGCFVILNIGGAAIVDWFRLRSGSLWTGVLLHNSHNIFVQAILTPLTIDTGKTHYFIDEFGIVLPPIMLAFGIYFWMRRKELTSFPDSDIRADEEAHARAQLL